VLQWEENDSATIKGEQIMDFFDLLVKRRSIRNYEEKEIPVETIKGII
jgi:hypothetical protein